MEENEKPTGGGEEELNSKVAKRVAYDEPGGDGMYSGIAAHMGDIGDLQDKAIKQAKLTVAGLAALVLLGTYFGWKIFKANRGN